MPAIDEQLKPEDTGVSAGGIETWHGRYQVVKDKGIKAKDLLKLAGLEWMVETTPLYTLYDGEYREFPGRVATRRADTGAELGVVTTEYQPIQNGDIVSLVETWLKSKKVLAETAGSLYGNRRVFFTFQAPDTITVAGIPGEDVKQFLLATSRHDGLEGLRFRWCYERVVCANTLAIALGEPGAQGMIRHIGNAKEAVEEARAILEIGFKARDAYQETAERLLEAKQTVEDVEQFLKGLIPLEVRKGMTEEAVNTELDRVNRFRVKIKDVWASEADLAPIRDTKYGVLQAVAAYDQHHRKFMDSPQRSGAERRFEITMGLGEGWGATQGSLAIRAARILTGESLGTKALDRQLAAALSSD